MKRLTCPNTEFYMPWASVNVLVFINPYFGFSPFIIVTVKEGNVKTLKVSEKVRRCTNTIFSIPHLLQNIMFDSNKLKRVTPRACRILQWVVQPKQIIEHLDMKILALLFCEARTREEHKMPKDLKVVVRTITCYSFSDIYVLLSYSHSRSCYSRQFCIARPFTACRKTTLAKLLWFSASFITVAWQQRMELCVFNVRFKFFLGLEFKKKPWTNGLHECSTRIFIQAQQDGEDFFSPEKYFSNFPCFGSAKLLLWCLLSVAAAA